jgi:hypothetical protein
MSFTAPGLLAEGQPQVVVQTFHRRPVERDHRERQYTVDRTDGHQHR